MSEKTTATGEKTTATGEKTTATGEKTTTTGEKTTTTGEKTTATGEKTTATGEKTTATGEKTTATGEKTTTTGEKTTATGEKTTATGEKTTATGEKTTATDEDWKPKTLKDNEKLSEYNSVEEALQALADAKLAPKLPEKYTLPEGAPEQLGEFAKQAGLTQGQLDSMLMLQQSMTNANNDNIESVNKKGLDTLLNEWGDSKDANIQMAKRALKFADPEGEVSKMLEITRAGNNPAVVRFLHKIGQILQEGGFIKTGNRQHKAPPEMAHRLYPNDVPK